MYKIENHDIYVVENALGQFDILNPPQTQVPLDELISGEGFFEYDLLTYQKRLHTSIVSKLCAHQLETLRKHSGNLLSPVRKYNRVLDSGVIEGSLTPTSGTRGRFTYTLPLSLYFLETKCLDCGNLVGTRINQSEAHLVHNLNPTKHDNRSEIRLAYSDGITVDIPLQQSHEALLFELITTPKKGW